MPEPFRVDVASQQSTTALIYPAATKPPAGVTLILGHGAGAGQTSDFMTSFAGGEVQFLADLDSATQWEARKALLRGAVPSALIALS